MSEGVGGGGYHGRLLMTTREVGGQRGRWGRVRVAPSTFNREEWPLWPLGRLDGGDELMTDWQQPGG